MQSYDRPIHVAALSACAIAVVVVLGYLAIPEASAELAMSASNPAPPPSNKPFPLDGIQDECGSYFFYEDVVECYSMSQAQREAVCANSPACNTTACGGLFQGCSSLAEGWVVQCEDESTLKCGCLCHN